MWRQGSELPYKLWTRLNANDNAFDPALDLMVA